ncbi:hypothetical protein, partial [Microbacterium sp.]|uniref:hypothetical protein n=1 Tax=Microbacterium sp. TaxID=51671 RepID=UPI002735E6F0
ADARGVIANMTLADAKALAEHEKVTREATAAMRNLPFGVKVALRRFQAAQPIPMQHGGIVRQPTFALIGEAGPEAVIPLNSRETLAMLDAWQEFMELGADVQRMAGAATLPRITGPSVQATMDLMRSSARGVEPAAGRGGDEFNFDLRGAQIIGVDDLEKQIVQIIDRAKRQQAMEQVGLQRRFAR